MKGKSEILRLVEISRFYYEEGLTQAEIAKKLDISRPAISKLLSEARIRGIVKIEIKSPLESNERLLQALSSQFHLDGGLIVQTGSAEARLNQRLFVSQAAEYVGKRSGNLPKSDSDGDRTPVISWMNYNRGPKTAKVTAAFARSSGVPRMTSSGSRQTSWRGFSAIKPDTPLSIFPRRPSPSQMRTNSFLNKPMNIARSLPCGKNWIWCCSVSEPIHPSRTRPRRQDSAINFARKVPWV